MRYVAGLLALFLLSGCVSKRSWLNDCSEATFSDKQCNFMYKKRYAGVGISGPVIGGIIGVNLP